MMRKTWLKCINLERLIKPHLRLWGSTEPLREPLSPNGERLEYWGIIPGLVGLPKFIQVHSENSSRKSRKIREEHPRNFRPL